jgi:aminocarboxymuconate-semialdehyde decarboxylase
MSGNGDFKVIDGHRHILCPEAHRMAVGLDPVKATDYLDGADEASAAVNRMKGPAWNLKMTDPAEHMADLAGAGIDMGVLGPPPVGFYYWAEPSAGADLARLVNENTSRLVAGHRDRFVGLATAPLQDTALAIREIRHASGELGLKGVAMASNVNGQELDEERFFPFFEEVERLGLPVFIHPHHAAGAERMRKYYLINFLGYPVDTTLAAAQLIFGGVLDRFPGLKICLAHAGGVLPFLLGRFEHGRSVRPEAEKLCGHPVSHYLNNFYVDTITFRPETLRFVLETMPEGHVFLGTDYPFDMGDLRGPVSVTSAVDDPLLLKSILGKNLERLMNLPESDS